MSRHTIETIRDIIAELRGQDVVYKTEVDLLKHHFTRTFERDWENVKDTKHLKVPQSNQSSSDTALYFAAPYEVRHWYGKKFDKTLQDTPDSEFKDATVSHRNRWRPLYQALQDLIARQVKGRKPVERTKKVIGTRKQLRAVCPCCFKDHAVQGGRLVAHGYTLDYGFQNGNCRGVGKMHFGTTEGVQFTQDLIREVEASIERQKERCVLIGKRELKPLDQRGIIIEVPTQRQWDAFMYQIESQIRSDLFYTEFLQKMVSEWKFVEPVEVEVEITE